jgi:NADH:ubiquinone oxidoreductase subunit 6 (subunit J)
MNSVPPTAAPRNPLVVLAFAILLPGTGQVLNGTPNRGLMFLFFTVLLGWATFHLMPQTASFLGHYIGGVFVYGLSVIDAYKHARVRREKWTYAQTRETPDA